MDSKHGSMEDYSHLVGQQVYKRRSHKPFKSGKKVETVVSLCIHDHVPEIAVKFKDGSICAAHQLAVVDGQTGLVPGVDY